MYKNIDYRFYDLILQWDIQFFIDKVNELQKSNTEYILKELLDRIKESSSLNINNIFNNLPNFLVLLFIVLDGIKNDVVQSDISIKNINSEIETKLKELESKVLDLWKFLMRVKEIYESNNELYNIVLNDNLNSLKIKIKIKDILEICKDIKINITNE